ncbi:ABC transporter substrate-binding protein [Microvirga sp. KLBC 81]|uniref:ABC transporter substrate-binding protein n=1 Tax=Microvirga sp. KLBC 81 TaxID=1862707 RepID=UPI000D5207A8|nr:ABC transporter substrate-binding protein [Microvirga sp. KLBC 81]PVE21215.1 ABC transporter substrate-binding protein [Microvirga sp. KLBC 81]
MKLKSVASAAFLAAGAVSLTTATTALAQGRDKPFTVVLAVEPDSLDPCDTQTAQNANVVRGNVFESLTHVSPVTGQVEPMLVESWKHVSEKVWEFKLKQGVTFHDGTPFDAKVAAANIKRTQAGVDFYGGKLACYNSEQFPEHVESEAVDQYTLRVTTPRPDPILPLRLSYVDVGDLASQTKTDKITNPIGTGPYKFVSRTQGESIKLTRFDGYWGTKPEVKDVVYLYRAEPTVRAGMITTGEAQLATAIRAEDATGDDRTVSYKDNRIVLMRTNTYKEPFIDPRVRMAVSHAINREKIVPALMGITGSPWYQMLGPQVNGYIPNFDKTDALKYDPEKAKALIAAAKADGHPVDTEFDLVTRPDIFPGGDEVVQAIAQDLKSVGFKFKVLSIETSAWLKYLRRPFPPEQRATLQMISHDNTSGDASFSFPKYITCEGAVSATCNPEIDKIIKEADVAEGPKRAELYQQAARILYTKESSMIGIAEQARLMMLGEGVQYKPNPLSGLEIRIADIRLSK